MVIEMANCFLKLASCLLGLSLLTASVLSAQNLTDELVVKIAAPLVENKVADGLSIGYLEGDHYGIVHLGTATNNGKRADNLTVYEIGSISKVFTSLLLADAVVRGEIELDAAVNVDNAAGIRLPSYEGRAIQWIDLSTHRSGLPRLPANLEVTSLKNPYQLYDSTKASATLANLKLARKPGASHEYSNFAVSVLGYLLAEKAKSTYQDLLRETIAKPLGMNDCCVDLTSDQKKRFATPHDKFGSSTLAWTFADMPGAGGIHATMFDMMRFAKAQLSPPPGKLGEAIELTWKQHSTADASGPATGLGWMIHGDGETRWHNGGTGGSRTAILINRRIKSAVIVLCNTSVITEVDELAAQLIQVAAGIKIAKPVEGKSPADAKLRARLVGQYKLANFIFDVEDRAGHLMVRLSGQEFNEVFPDSETKWSYRGIDAMIEFKLDRTGPASQLTLHQNGKQQVARRIGK